MDVAELLPQEVSPLTGAGGLGGAAAAEPPGGPGLPPGAPDEDIALLDWITKETRLRLRETPQPIV